MAKIQFWELLVHAGNGTHRAEPEDWRTHLDTFLVKSAPERQLDLAGNAVRVVPGRLDQRGECVIRHAYPGNTELQRGSRSDDAVTIVASDEQNLYQRPLLFARFHDSRNVIATAMGSLGQPRSLTEALANLINPLPPGCMWVTAPVTVPENLAALAGKKGARKVRIKSWVHTPPLGTTGASLDELLGQMASLFGDDVKIDLKLSLRSSKHNQAGERQLLKSTRESRQIQQDAEEFSVEARDGFTTELVNLVETTLTAEATVDASPTDAAYEHLVLEQIARKLSEKADTIERSTELST